MSLENHIKNWVEIDNQYRKYSEKMKELRVNRSEMTSIIFDYAEENNLQNAVVEISDGKLKFQSFKQTSPLTFKYIQECLNDCIEDEEQVKLLINYIKKKREVKYVNDIKRSYSS